MNNETKTESTKTATKAEAVPTITPFAALRSACVEAGVSPAAKAEFDACVAIAKAIGAPSSFASHRNEVLTRVGALAGKAKATANGSKTGLDTNLMEAAKAVAKHEAQDVAEYDSGWVRELALVLGLRKVVLADTSFTVAITLAK